MIAIPKVCRIDEVRTKEMPLPGERVARLQLLDVVVRNAADLDGFVVDLLNWFMASDKAVTQPLKFGGGDTTIIVDALPICFYCFLDIESKRDSF